MSDFPMRINKYLALKGYSTRKGADELIVKRQVKVNGRVAVLGDKVLEADKVEVKGYEKRAGSYKYFAYHKPRGVVTHSAQDQDEDIEDLVRRTPELKGVFPVGRLDKDSSGLIILTNDGRITDRLLNPDREHEKEYVVQTKGPLRASFKEHMSKGVRIEGYDTRPAHVKALGPKRFSIVLTEGKKHQIRRMVVALHNEVAALERIRVMNVRLANLPKGNYRSIEGEELATFLRSLGL